MSRHSLLFLVPLAVVASLPAQGKIFSDTEFKTSSWSTFEVRNSGNNGTLFSRQEKIGGRPGAFRVGRHTWGPGQIEYAHLLAGAVYRPQVSGALRSLYLAADFVVLGSSRNDPVWAAVGYHPALRQNGRFYRVDGNVVQQRQRWQHQRFARFGASDFGLVDANGWQKTKHPDFGKTAAPIEFGFVTNNSTSNNKVWIEWGVDNYVVVIDGVRARCAIRNGSGRNPVAFACGVEPVIGGGWFGRIDRTATTTTTGIAVAMAPANVPFLGGELLVATTPDPLLLFNPSGTFGLPVPPFVSFAGRKVYVQGFREDRGLVLLNAQELVLGF